MLVLFLLGYLIQGMAEELLYRSYLMVTIARRYSMTVAVLISAVIGALPYAAGTVEAPACIFKRYAVRYFRGALSDPARKYMGNRSVSRGMEFCA